MIQITDFQILSKPYINGKIIIQLSDDASSQFHKSDPHDWFCGHMCSH